MVTSQTGKVAASFLVLLATACTSHSMQSKSSSPGPSAGDTAAAPPAPAASEPRSLESFRASAPAAQCYNRDTEPYTAVVDTHFHPRPFGGPAMRPEELFSAFDKLGVRFVNYFGIGQVLDLTSGCTYYLDCPGTNANPGVKNDFVNGMETVAYPHPKVHITLSMTFMDLADTEGALETIRMYDREFPGMFKWAGEVNVVKQALAQNGHRFATEANIDSWAPFMAVLRERQIPITLHSDLGNDANPTQYLHLMQYVVSKYPDNKIVWAHMGLSKELQNMDPKQHVAIMTSMLDSSPNLMLDISWDVLYNAYHQYGPDFLPFFEAYSTRILPGSDFVAAGTKSFEQYQKELEITSRVNKALSDEAFRNIALGGNYFRLMNLDYKAPEVCAR
jgi:Amidohydrolase